MIDRIFFETAFANNPIDFEDLPYIDEEYLCYETFLNESEISKENYQLIDSLIVSAEMIIDLDSYPLQKKTGAKKEIKSTPNKNTPTLDELSEDEILEYFYQNDSMELIKDLH